jgi:hypothetical protein
LQQLKREETMNSKNALIMTIGLLLVLSVSGCAGYGKLVPESVSGDQMTVAALEKNWQEYNVYAAPMAAAIIFAPKGHKKTLEVTSHWTRVTDDGELLRMVKDIEAQPDMGLYRPAMWRIMGPKGGFYGYIFTAWDSEHVVIKEVSKDVMVVYGITQPPYLELENEGPGNGGGDGDGDGDAD